MQCTRPAGGKMLPQQSAGQIQKGWLACPWRRKHKSRNAGKGMVKASGYGAGSYEIAKTLQDAGCDYLAVAVQDEGVDLRKAGITMPIIVLNPSVVNYKAMFTHHLEPEVYSIEECSELIKEGAKYGAHEFPVHIKLDTGMHRLGFTKEQIPALINSATTLSAISSTPQALSASQISSSTWYA